MSPTRTPSTLHRSTDPTQAAANSTAARPRGQGDRNEVDTQGNKSNNTGGRKKKSNTNPTRGHGTAHQASNAGQEQGTNNPASSPLVPTSNGNTAADGLDTAAELARLRAQIELLQNAAASNGQSALSQSTGATQNGATQNGTQNANSANGSPVQNGVAAIRVINKPRGEPGNGRTGYSLQTEMRVDDDVQYNEFLASVRRNAARSGIDYRRSYKHQDLSAIDNVCKLCVKENPYLTKRRFPNYWPITAALKVHIANARKYRKRRVTEHEQEGGHDDSDRENNDVNHENDDVDA